MVEYGPWKAEVAGSSPVFPTKTNYMEISELIGQTLVSIEGAVIGGDEIIFTCESGDKFRMYHGQDCCESVGIDDIVGDINDLRENPITMAEEISSNDAPAPEHADSFTWTFYRLATLSGYVTIKWLGESNGYYSESVDFEKIA